MEKYRQLLKDSITDQLNEWSGRESVTEGDIFLFFHKLKGTAATVGLTDWEDHLQTGLSVLSRSSDRPLSGEELDRWLKPFRQLQGDADSEEQMLTDREERVDDSHLILMIQEETKLAEQSRKDIEAYGIQVITAFSVQKGVELLYRFSPSTIVADFETIEHEGETDSKRQLFEKASQDFIPVVYLTNQSEDREKIKVYEEGASDYLVRPVAIDVFIALLANRMMFRSRVQKALTLDELTGALNRGMLNSRMQDLVRGRRRQGERGWSFVMLDLDFFKRVNDQYGHATGDEVLQAFVKVCKKETAGTGDVFRYGGEEFALLLFTDDRQAVNRVLDSIRERMDTIIFYSGSDTFQVTFSAGVYINRGSEADAKRIIESADEALYSAKHFGRNQTVFAEDLTKRQALVRTIRILLVDDDPVIRGLAKEELSSIHQIDNLPVTFEAFEDGRTFRDASWYQPEDYFVILLDGYLPDIDGFDLLQSLRETYKSENMVISMVTARNADEDVMHALENGADDYITKPFSAPQLAARVKKMASRAFQLTGR